MTKAYYNEFDPYAAQWLRNLIEAGHIAYGDVDERSITEVTPNDLKGYTQCHFFAGIGVWSHALRQANWSDSRHVWTGSCPCQPFSAAGRKKGLNDDRHLWPVWFELIKQCQPNVIFGEQVSSKDALPWIDNVQTDLESENYSVGALDICAAGVGAPHIRQRLFWVGHSDCIRTQKVDNPPSDKESANSKGSNCPELDTRTSDSLPDGLAHPNGGASGGNSRGISPQKTKRIAGNYSRNGSKSSVQALPPRLANAEGERYDGCNLAPKGGLRVSSETSGFVLEGQPCARPTSGFWGNADWLYCTDGKWRAVEPLTFPLADGGSGRMGRLRAYGNAINAEVAKTFIESYLEILQ